MAFRIANVNPDPTPKARPKKEGAYLDFVRTLPCCITGRHGVQAAHLSFAAPRYGHYGRGKQHKASDRWALPLCPEEHRIQHSGSEAAYWMTTGINPHVLALVLHGIWSEFGASAYPFAEAVIYQQIQGARNA